MVWARICPLGSIELIIIDKVDKENFIKKVIAQREFNACPCRIAGDSAKYSRS